MQHGCSGSGIVEQEGVLMTSSPQQKLPISVQQHAVHEDVGMSCAPVKTVTDGLVGPQTAQQQEAPPPAAAAEQQVLHMPVQPRTNMPEEQANRQQQQQQQAQCSVPPARPAKRVLPVALAAADAPAGAVPAAGSKPKRARSTVPKKDPSLQQQTKQGFLSISARASPDAAPSAPVGSSSGHAAAAGLWPRAATSNATAQQPANGQQGQEQGTSAAEGSAAATVVDSTHATGKPAQKRFTPASLVQNAAPATTTGQPTSVDHQAAMRALLENLALTGDEQTDPPPKALLVSLLPHQRMALAWMLKRELGSSPKGGILADDQGLGKTITTVAVIVSNMPDPLATASTTTSQVRSSSISPPPPAASHADVACGADQQVTPTIMPGSSAGAAAVTAGQRAPCLRPGGTLVVCPTSVLHQWHREMGDKVNKHTSNFTVHIYHGKDKASSAQQLSRYTVVLTTYGTLAQEAPAKAQRAKQRQRTQQRKVVQAAAGSGSEWLSEDTYLDSDSDGDGQWQTFGSSDVTGGLLHSSEAQQLQGHGQDVIKQEPAVKQEHLLLPIKAEMKQESGDELPVKLEQVKQEVQHGNTAGQLSTEPQAAVEAAMSSKFRRSGSTGSMQALLGSRQPEEATGTGGLLYQVSWHRVVLDEAQTIKNARTLVAQAAWQLTAKHRWCLSGTPIQNSVDDLFSYFRFLRYAPYDQPAGFKALIRNKIAADSEAGYKLLQAVLQGVLLRRTKQSKLPNGDPIIALPPRQQNLAQCDFNTAQEAAFYNQLQEESRQAVQAEHVAGGSPSYANMLHSLLRLRQACSHPWLVKGISLQAQQALTGSNQSKRASAAQAQQVSAAKKLSTSEQQRLLQGLLQLQAQCPVCQDAPEAPLTTRCAHVYCADCICTQLEGAGHVDEFTCITCSRVVRNTEVYSAAALQQALGQPAALGSTGPATGNLPKTGGWVSSTKIDKLLQLLNTIRQRNKDTVPAAGPAPGNTSVLAVRSKADQALVRTFKSLATRPTATHHSAAHRPEKVIVFSQWTGMLDLVEQALRLHKHPFRRLDGSMNIAARDQAVADFQQKQEVNVLLVSLKAAALGLNLTAANHVVLMDLWWNPTQEEQAIDRAHRIGQKRAVEVTRITIKGTVEDRILQLQERKRQLIAASLAEGQAAGGNKLTMEDLRFLFLGDGKQQA